MQSQFSSLRSIFRSKSGSKVSLTGCAFALLAFQAASASSAQSLNVTYGAKGLQTLSFGGTTLEDVQVYPADSFHIWHMKSTGLDGSLLNQGGYGWGESNTGETWNPATDTETYTFAWGSIGTRFVQQGNNLDVIVTEQNNAGSGILFDGAEVYPFALHFPQDPKGFYGYTQYAITTTGPGVSVADFGSGIVTSVIPDESTPMYGGWKQAGWNAYSPLMATTAPDGLATFLPHNDRPVQPGETFTYTVSLRFTPEGTPASAADAYASFAETYPSQMTWTDRRAIGTVYLASSPAGGGDITQPGGFPTNPRRYFNDPNVDVTTPQGLESFQDRMLQQAASNAANALSLESQGVITWDIEGEQYPQDTSYVCSPDQIAAVAPEMESTILDPASGFFGQKLDDAYFKTITNAGLRVGVCLRPQQFTLGGNGTASQITLAGNPAIIANLQKKARYANARWGVTLFYVDSTVDSNGGTLDPAIFQQLITDLPNFFFIPEESTPRYYAYSAPFYSFIFHTTLGTDPSVYRYYPKAFGANLVNDVSPGTLAAYTPQLTQSVASGDILMAHVDYWQTNDPAIVSIYRAAGVTSPQPVKRVPSIQWNAPAAIGYGVPLTATQLNAAASTPGTFTYSPAAGTLLSAGVHTLSVSFTPADQVHYLPAKSEVTLTVRPLGAAAKLTWNSPAPIYFKTPLDELQLDATANVPGTFTYSPAKGAVLPTGNRTLQVTFQPEDNVNYRATRMIVPIQVMRATPVLTWKQPAPIRAGTPLEKTQLHVVSQMSGSLTYNPAPGVVLGPGTYTLNATFTPNNLNDFVVATIQTQLVVSPF